MDWEWPTTNQDTEHNVLKNCKHNSIEEMLHNSKNAIDEPRYSNIRHICWYIWASPPSRGWWTAFWRSASAWRWWPPDPTPPHPPAGCTASCSSCESDRCDRGRPPRRPPQHCRPQAAKKKQKKNFFFSPSHLKIWANKLIKKKGCEVLGQFFQANWTNTSSLKQSRIIGTHEK